MIPTVEKEGPHYTSARSGQAVTDGDTAWDNGFYVTAIIWKEHSLDLLVDTGSTVTMISIATYRRLSKGRNIALMPTNFELKSVDGSLIHVEGQLKLNLSFNGTVDRFHRIVVADIHQDAILGNDFLIAAKCDLFLWRSLMRINGHDIPLRQITGGPGIVCRVEIKHQVSIPPHSVQLVDVKIQDAEHLDNVAMLEPAADLFLRKEILAAKGITDPQDTSQVMQIINCSEQPVKLPAGFTLGTCKSFEEVNYTSSATTADDVSTSINNDNIEPNPLFNNTNGAACNNVTSQPPVDGVVNKQQPVISSSNKQTAVEQHESDLYSDKQTTTEQQLPDHLIDLWKRSSEHLNEEDSQRVANLLTFYQGVFARSDDDLGKTSLVQHTINTGDYQPVRQPPRRQPMERRAAEREQIEKMLKAGIIEPSTSPWASGIVLVPKKDGTVRFCVDYRILNALTVKDSYPLPRIDECLDSLEGAVWFNSMDLCSGYWQVEMAPQDKPKTAFASRMGLYHFNVMPFGLTNAPSTFERLMDTVLRGLQWEECLVYLDDIIVPGRSVPECVDRLAHVFDRLSTAGLKLKPSKCTFFQKEVTFLGHVVSEAGVSTDPSKIEVVKDWPVPIDVKQVRSFLGLSGYYRRFIKDFAKIAAPLHKLTRKGTLFEWSEKCQAAFETLKTALTTAPVLGYPSCDGQYTLDTDASHQAIGSVLSQDQKGKETVIAYFSKVLKKEEKNYCITRKELLAVVESVKHFRYYIYGRPTILRTDNAAVSWLRNLKDPAGQMARWLQHLETFDLQVTHRPGYKHTNADALSRRPCKQCSQAPKDDKLPTNDGNQGEVTYSVNTESVPVRVTTRQQQREHLADFRPLDFLLDGWDPLEIRAQQQADSDIAAIMNAVEAGQTRPLWQDISSESQNLKTLWRQWDRLDVKGGLLYRKFYDEDGSFRWQLVVPRIKKKEILYQFHDSPTGGHLGAERTLEKVRNHFYWTGLKNYVQNYCKRCDKCAARKHGQTKKAPLRQYTVGSPMERLSIDILGPLPETTNGNKYIVVVADHFSKWIEAFALPDQTSETVASVVVREVVCRFGTPLQLHSDQGANFEAKLFQDMVKLLGIQKTRTTGLHPQSDGLVERYNRTLLTMLTMYAQDDQQTWDTYLPFVMMAYRASKHDSTGLTPNLLMLGREINLPLTAVVATPKEEDGEAPDYEDYVADLQERMHTAHEIARTHLKKAAVHQKQQYDPRTKSHALTAGQPVWLWDPSRKKGLSPKLTSKWKGPFVVVQKIDDLVYRIQRGPRTKAKVVHINRLRVYEGENPPTWFQKTRQD